MKKIMTLFLSIAMIAVLAANAPSELPIKASLIDAVTSTQDFKEVNIKFKKPNVIVDTDDISIHLNSVSVDEDEYLVLDTLVTNKKEKIEYEVSIKRASVNGIEIHPTYTEYVIDECDEPIEIDLSNAIENAKIKDITDIELEVNIEDEDLKTVLNKTVHVYPYGKKKAKKYERKPEDSDIKIVDNDKIAVYVTDLEYVEGWGYSIHLFIQNKTENDIYVNGQYYTLNDKTVDTLYDDVVGAGGVNFSRVEWSQGDLDDAGIKKVSKIKFLFRAYDEKTDKMILDKEIKLEPKSK